MRVRLVTSFVLVLTLVLIPGGGVAAAPAAPQPWHTTGNSGTDPATNFLGTIDTVDLVVVGAFAGRGRRRGTYGALLLAAYDPAAEVFRAVT